MFSKQLIKEELIKDVRSRAKGSAIGNIFLSFVFLAISHRFLMHFKIFIYIAVVSIFVNIARVVCSQQIAYVRFTDFLTIAAGICWGSLFCFVYLNLGLYQLPTLSLYIILAGISSSATSSLFGQKKLLCAFLVSVLIVPGAFMIYNESLISEKFFGVLPISFFIFLYIQSSINRKNLIARIESLGFNSPKLASAFPCV